MTPNLHTILTVVAGVCLYLSQNAQVADLLGGLMGTLLTAVGGAILVVVKGEQIPVLGKLLKPKEPRIFPVDPDVRENEITPYDRPPMRVPRSPSGTEEKE